ncbi:Nup133 N terminal like-domain-containing protein [Gaertneriomyces semiglobifer]|nr:Nup133 N terminal like-domain-containing protein [Gaertneriomyces semiglobifer]
MMGSEGGSLFRNGPDSMRGGTGARDLFTPASGRDDSRSRTGGNRELFGSLNASTSRNRRLFTPGAGRDDSMIFGTGSRSTFSHAGPGVDESLMRSTGTQGHFDGNAGTSDSFAATFQHTNDSMFGMDVPSASSGFASPPAPLLPSSSARFEERLVAAKDLLQERIQHDNYPDLYSLLERLGPEGTRGQDVLAPGSGPVMKKHDSPLPPFIYEQYDQVQCRAYMGILPEIHRAWVSIDSRAFLWDYTSSTEEAPTQVEINNDQVIATIGIVKPVKGIFLEQIEYLLIVSTPLEILTVGLAFAVPGDTSTRVVVYDTEVKVSSDRLAMKQIVGTEEGRVFCLGQDGQLYEFRYQKTDSWFNKRVELKNHSASMLSLLAPSFLDSLRLHESPHITYLAYDKDRKLLYSVSQKSDVEAIYLGPKGDQFNRLRPLRDAVNHTLGPGHSVDVRLAAIYPIAPAESHLVQAIAITTRGDRIYLSVSSGSSSQPSAVQSTYALPGIERAMGSEEVHEVYYSSGLLLTATSVNDEVDKITALSANVGEIAQLPVKVWTDAVSNLQIDGVVHQFAELNQKSAKLKPLVAVSEQPGFVLNTLSTQLENPPRSFQLLTTAGVTNLVKLRPIDELCQIISSSTDNGAAFSAFYEAYGPQETCAMCLAIACRHPSAVEAVQLFAPTNQAEVISRAGEIFFEHGGAPTLTSDDHGTGKGFGSSVAQPTTEIEVKHSGRHDGLALYMARVLRPLWKNRVFVNRNGSLISNFSNEDLVLVQSMLDSLQAFIMSRAGFVDQPSPDAVPTHGESEEAWRYEQESLYNLNLLLKMCVEIVRLTTILGGQDVTMFVKKACAAQTSIVDNITFEELALHGRDSEVSRILMWICMEKLQGEHKEKTQRQLGEELMAMCPSICEQSELLLLEGQDAIAAAHAAQTGTADRHRKLREALRILSKALHAISYGMLVEISNEFKALQFYDGLIHLCLQWADARKATIQPEPIGQHGMGTSGSPREECFLAYGLILQTLADLRSSADVPENHVHYQETASLYRRSIDRALSSHDRDFHEALYDMYISRGWMSHLLAMVKKPPFYEDYLRSRTDEPVMADMLANYYVSTGQFKQAAVLYRSLADRPNWTFAERYQLLVMASTQATTAMQTSGETGDGALQDIADAVAVADIQAAVLRKLQPWTGTRAEDMKAELNESLLTVTDLFHKFAKPLEFFDVQLKCISVSHTQNNVIVVNLWDQIIRRGLDKAGPGVDPFLSLRQAITSTVEYLGHDGSVIPTDHIVRKLLEWTYNARREQRRDLRQWLIDTVMSLNMKTPRRALSAAIVNQYQNKLPPWNSSEGAAYLMSVLCLLAADWLHKE